MNKLENVEFAMIQKGDVDLSDLASYIAGPKKGKKVVKPVTLKGATGPIVKVTEDSMDEYSFPLFENAIAEGNLIPTTRTIADFNTIISNYVSTLTDTNIPVNVGNIENDICVNIIPSLYKKGTKKCQDLIDEIHAKHYNNGDKQLILDKKLELLHLYGTKLHTAIETSKANKEEAFKKYFDTLMEIAKTERQKEILKEKTHKSGKTSTKVKKGLAITVAGVMVVVGALHLGKNISKNGGAQQQTVKVTSTPYNRPTAAPYVAPTVAPYYYDDNNYSDYESNSGYTVQEIINTVVASGYSAYNDAQLEGLKFLLNPNNYSGYSNEARFQMVCDADPIITYFAENNLSGFLSQDAINALSVGNYPTSTNNYTLYDVMHSMRIAELNVINACKNGEISSEQLETLINGYELNKTIALSKTIGKTEENKTMNAQSVDKVKTIGAHPSYSKNA